jgi:hypothetical protein
MVSYDPLTSKCSFYLDLFLAIYQTQGLGIPTVKKTKEKAFSLFADKRCTVRRMLSATPLPRQESAK